MMMAAGGADRERRERRLINEASRFAGRWLHQVDDIQRVDLVRRKRHTWNSRKSPPCGRSGHDVADGVNHD